MVYYFPKYLHSPYFYRFILPKLVAFSASKATDDLVIDLQKTDYIEPNVICDFLCYLKYHQDLKGTPVYLLFGNSTTLRSYLENTLFFMHSEQGAVFKTDIINYRFINANNYNLQAYNTGKIKRVNIPVSKTGEQKHLPLDIEHDIQMQIRALFSQYKLSNMKKYGLKDREELTAAFIEIIDNSYVHSKDFRKCGCYYTFQAYESTGLNFACSDIGIGFYESLLRKYIYERTASPRLFTLEEFLSFGNNNRVKNLAAILECLVFRIGESENVEYGFPYIFENFVLPFDNEINDAIPEKDRLYGNLVIHSEDTLLRVDLNFLHEFFQIETKVNNKGESVKKITGFFADGLRDLIYNKYKRFEKEDQRLIRLFDYSLPGVHISVTIGKGKWGTEQ